MKVKFTVICGNGDFSRELMLPGKYSVCHRCNGQGKHTNPAIDSHGITQDEFDENPGFQEAYMNGVYDITCQECGGERVKPELCMEKLPKALRKRIENQLRDLEDYYSEQRHYRMLANAGIEY